ncbi:hypothetical protein QIW49_09025 [Francisellaceae bacterium CB300]
MKKIIPTLLGLALAISSFAAINTIENKNGAVKQLENLQLDENYNSQESTFGSYTPAEGEKLIKTHMFDNYSYISGFVAVQNKTENLCLTNFNLHSDYGKIKNKAEFLNNIKASHIVNNCDDGIYSNCTANAQFIKPHEIGIWNFETTFYYNFQGNIWFSYAKYNSELDKCELYTNSSFKNKSYDKTPYIKIHGFQRNLAKLVVESDVIIGNYADQEDFPNLASVSSVLDDGFGRKYWAFTAVQVQ